MLSANDIIAETSIDLYRWFLKVCLRACARAITTVTHLLKDRYNRGTNSGTHKKQDSVCDGPT